MNNLIKLIGNDTSIRDIATHLNTALNENFKETNNRGLINKNNKYSQVKITSIGREKINGDNQKVVEVSLLKLNENPLENLSVDEYLIKSFHLDNEYMPMTNGLLYNPEPYSFAHLMNYYLENHTKEGYSPRIIGIDTIDERTTTFTISFGSKNKQPVLSKFQLSVDTNRLVGRGFGNNNGVIGREPLYGLSMTLLG